MLTNKINVTNVIILILFCMTFYTRSIIPLSGIVYSRIYYIEIFLFFLLIVSILDLRNLFNFSFERLNLFHLFIFISFLFFFISSFYINFQYNNNIESLAKLISYFVIIITFFYIFAKQLYLSEEFFEKLTDFIILIGTLFSVYAIIDIFILGIHPVEEYRFSTSGIFAHPNNASFLYTILIPLIIYKYYKRRIQLSRFLFLLLIFLFCLLLTFSRAGYVGVFISILVMTYFRSKTIFILTLIVLFFVISTFVLDIAVAKGDSSISRGMLMITAINMIIHDNIHFLWGYGVFNAIDVFIAEKIYAGNFENIVSPHNILLLVTIQFGVLFTISILLAMVYLYIKVIIIKRKLKSENLNLRLNVCIAITLGLICQDMFEGMVGYPEFFLMPIFFTFYGFLYYFVRYNKKIKV